MYTIGDFLIRVKNGYMARKREVLVPYSKVAESLATILAEEEFIKSSETVGEDGSKKQLKVSLRYNKGIPAMHDVEIVSKPSVQVYVNKNKVGGMKRNIGINIISTSKGMMTSEKAFKQGLGGEFICNVA